MPRQAIDMTTFKLPKGKVLRRGSNKGHLTTWVVECGTCGKEHDVAKPNLFHTSGLCKKCSGKESGDKRVTHGQSRKNAKTPEYQSWRSMWDRCTNPKSSNYKGWGGKGITVEEPGWSEFANFFRDMGPKPGPQYTLDRIDNSKGYSKVNCRWATKQEQSRNQRSNVVVTFHGITACIAEICERLKMDHLLVRRIKWDRSISWIEALDIIFSRTHPKMNVPKVEGLEVSL